MIRDIIEQAYKQLLMQAAVYVAKGTHVAALWFVSDPKPWGKGCFCW